MEEEGAVQDHVRFLRRGMRTRGKNQREMLETQSPVAWTEDAPDRQGEHGRG